MFTPTWKRRADEPPGSTAEQSSGCVFRARAPSVVGIHTSYCSRNSLSLFQPTRLVLYLRWLSPPSHSQLCGLLASRSACPSVVARCTGRRCTRHEGRQLVCLPTGGLRARVEGTCDHSPSQPPPTLPAAAAHTSTARCTSTLCGWPAPVLPRPRASPPPASYPHAGTCASCRCPPRTDGSATPRTQTSSTTRWCGALGPDPVLLHPGTRMPTHVYTPIIDGSVRSRSLVALVRAPKPHLFTSGVIDLLPLVYSLATTPWFTITGTHMFITSGTSTVMIQHHLHHVDGSTTTAPHCL
jgi:hypothetical protein